MPNGDPNFPIEEMDNFFDPFKELIEGFADHHNLYFQKYYHDSPSWSLCFNNPKGGKAKISIVREKNDSLSVNSTWWLDDYDKYTRYIHWGSKKSCEKDVNSLSNALKSELFEILSWKLGNWTEVAKGYEDIWGDISKSEFEAMGPHYSEPTNI